MPAPAKASRTDASSPVAFSPPEGFVASVMSGRIVERPSPSMTPATNRQASTTRLRPG